MSNRTTSRPTSKPRERDREAEMARFREFSADRTRERERLIATHLPLARAMAQRYLGSDEPFEDLLQVACVGLVEAVDRFDPEHGFAFTSFATPTILGELRRHFRDHTWAVHVPRGAKELRIQMNAAVDEMTSQLGRSPTVDELAARLHLRREQVLEGLEASSVYSAVSLDGLQGVDPIDEQESMANDVLDRHVLASLMERLPTRERNILYLRYFQELTQAQIAERVGTSQVHVGRLIASSLSSLREWAEERSA